MEIVKVIEEWTDSDGVKFKKVLTDNGDTYEIHQRISPEEHKFKKQNQNQKNMDEEFHKALKDFTEKGIGYYSVASDDDIKINSSGEYTSNTITINISEEDELTEKEKLVENLLREGAINIKQAMILLDMVEMVVRSDPGSSPSPYTPLYPQIYFTTTIS